MKLTADHLERFNLGQLSELYWLATFTLRRAFSPAPTFPTRPAALQALATVRPTWVARFNGIEAAPKSP